VEKTKPCNWGEPETKCLLSILEKFGESARERGGINWYKVSIEMNNNGFTYSSTQISTKWKNLKQTKKNNKYKKRIDGILGKNKVKKK